MASHLCIPRFQEVTHSLSKFRGKSRVSDITLRSVAFQVAMGTHSCHTPPATNPILLHRDIKPENGVSFLLEEIQRRLSNVMFFAALVMTYGNVKCIILINHLKWARPFAAIRSATRERPRRSFDGELTGGR